jgi:hypothetical protein
MQSFCLNAFIKIDLRFNYQLLLHDSGFDTLLSLGQNDDSPFRGILDFGFDGLRFVFQRSPFYGRHFAQPRGQAKRSRDPASRRSYVV